MSVLPAGGASTWPAVPAGTNVHAGHKGILKASVLCHDWALLGSGYQTGHVYIAWRQGGLTDIFRIVVSHSALTPCNFPTCVELSKVAHLSLTSSRPRQITLVNIRNTPMTWPSEQTWPHFRYQSGLMNYSTSVFKTVTARPQEPITVPASYSSYSKDPLSGVR